MPIKDDDDDEDYLNDYNEDDKASPSQNSHIPSLLSQPMCKPSDTDMHHDTDIRFSASDNDMRTLADLDFRPPPSDSDYRSYNMHGMNPDMEDDYYGDGDYRGNEQDYRGSYDDEEDYYDEGRNWQRNGSPYGNFGPGRNYGGFGQNNFRPGNSFSRNDANGSQGVDGGWGSPGQGGDNFRAGRTGGGNARRSMPPRGARGNRGPNRNMRARSGGLRGGPRGRY